jgi:hypothetical protein
VYDVFRLTDQGIQVGFGHSVSSVLSVFPVRNMSEKDCIPDKKVYDGVALKGD